MSGDSRERLRFLPPPGFWTGVRGLAAHVAKHLFTSADGDTYAIGRFLGFVLMFWGLGAPTVACCWMIYKGQITTVDEWIAFIGAMNLYVPAIVGAVIALITLTNSTEPKAPPAPRDDPDARPLA